MSLYKTQRCRHFDEAGIPIKPYCTQGNKCRFIHPNDRQWAKLRRRNDETPSPGYREVARSKGKNKFQLSPGSPLHRQRSSPLISQTDLFKRKPKEISREHGPRDWSVCSGDRRRDPEPRAYTRERDVPFEQGHSLKRTNEEGDPYPNQRPRLSEHAAFGSTSGGDTHHTTQMDKIASPSSHDPKTTIRVSDTFHHLAKLCCEIVQDTCFLDREEDKLKAFTGLSSELSRAVPDAAMAVTPALATVINGHSRARERLGNRVGELEALWKTLFSMLESDISKAIDFRLEQAMTLLGNERDSALRLIAHSQKLVGDKLYDGMAGPCQWASGCREATTERATTSSERSAMSINGGLTANVSPEETCHHGGPGALSVVPTQGVDLGSSLRVVLEDMKMQMDRQTRAIELLAKENLQLKSVSDDPPHPVAPGSSSSSPRKPSVF